MAEERMLNDEILLGLIKANSGGGGGGTSDYEDLSNKPQIGGVELVGNKTAAQLGLATETALADKVDKVAGKGLSTNDYTNEDKAIVGGVTAALAGKQNALTAGNNIKLDNDTISVNRWAVPAGKVVYTVITSDENYGQNVHVQRHTTGGALIDDRTFLCVSYTTVNVDDLISIYNPYSSFRITLLEDSDEQQAGYSYTVNPITTPTSNSFTFMMEQEENANDLIIRSELDAALATKADLTDLAPAFSTSTAYTVGQYVSYDGNIYKCTSAHSAGAWAAGDFTLVAVGSELESKQNATDNSLQTTDKTVVGAINEHEGDISSLMSGLTDIHDGFKDAIGWDNHKNLLPITIDDIKANNTNGTWSGNTYMLNGVSFAVNLDQYGHVLSVTINGTNTNTWNTRLWLTKESQTLVSLDAGDYDIRCINANEYCYLIINTTIWQDGQPVVNSNEKLVTIDENCYLTAPLIQLRPSVTVDNKTLYPEFYKHKYSGMDYQPYYPVIGLAVENVQSSLTNKANVASYNMGGGQTVNIQHTGIVAIMSDRGGLYCDGIANRGLNDLVPSTQVTVTHVDAAHVTVANNSQYGTSILVLSDGDITITLVQ